MYRITMREKIEFSKSPTYDIALIQVFSVNMEQRKLRMLLFFKFHLYVEVCPVPLSRWMADYQLKT